MQEAGIRVLCRLAVRSYLPVPWALCVFDFLTWTLFFYVSLSLFLIIMVLY